MKKLFIFDVDYISLPCSALSTVGAIIVCKDTLRRPNNTETWNVLEVHILTHPPQNHGLFFEKEKAVFFAEKLIELSNNPTIDTMANQELKWEKMFKAFVKTNDEKPNNDPIDTTDQRREYKDHEFCKAVKCKFLKSTLEGHAPVELNKCSTEVCHSTAKHFHKWLKENDFEIKKKI